MSSFQITGHVTKVEEKTSQKGNKFVTFQVQDHLGKVFELSLFGEGMQFVEAISGKKPVTIKGMLSSREFVDKNNVTRYGIDLRPSWIEEVEEGKKPAKEAKAGGNTGEFDFDSIPF